MSEIRATARLLMLDAHGRVLLQQLNSVNWPGIWIPPGGGIKPGESTEAAAIREALEETGFVIPPALLGPVIATATGPRLSGAPGLSHSSYFLVRIEGLTKVEPQPEEHETHLLRGERWWTLDDLASTDELTAPQGLAELLPPLLAGEIPSQPRVLTWLPTRRLAGTTTPPDRPAPGLRPYPAAADHHDGGRFSR
ncbi:NUDIX hydrolase [Nonomuraea sp. NPDC055795]